MLIRFLKISFMVLCCFSFSMTACQSNPPSSWNLVGAESKINYVSIKNNNLMENNSFEILEGSVNLDGSAEFLINLNSVHTNNDIRDERLRKILFKTETYPIAKVTSLINLFDYEKLSVGSSIIKNCNFTITFQGLTRSFEAKMEIFRLGTNKVLVKNIDPVIIDGGDYGLHTEFKQLQQLAGLDSIVPVVPVTVSLLFER